MSLSFLQGILPWLGLLLPAAAMLCFVVGVSQAFKQPQIYRGNRVIEAANFLRRKLESICTGSSPLYICWRAQDGP
jgi:hypothetical protein